MAESVFQAFTAGDLPLEDAQTALSQLVFPSPEEARLQLGKISRRSLVPVLQAALKPDKPTLVESFVELILWLSDTSLIDIVTSLSLLEELLESLDLPLYEKVFHHVEARVKTMELVRTYTAGGECSEHTPPHLQSPAQAAFQGPPLPIPLQSAAPFDPHFPQCE